MNNLTLKHKIAKWPIKITFYRSTFTKTLPIPLLLAFGSLRDHINLIGLPFRGVWFNFSIAEIAKPAKIESHAQLKHVPPNQILSVLI